MSFIFKLLLENTCAVRNQKRLGVIWDCCEDGFSVISFVLFVPHSSAFVSLKACKGNLHNQQSNVENSAILKFANLLFLRGLECLLYNNLIKIVSCQK